MTITGIEANSVDCDRHDPKTGVTEVYVGLRDEFADYKLLSAG